MQYKSLIDADEPPERPYSLTEGGKFMQDTREARTPRYTGNEDNPLHARPLLGAKPEQKHAPRKGLEDDNWLSSYT
jgi:hypothetical protein